MYYREILPSDVLDLAPMGAFNFHPSLLPRHRGCFSAPWAIIDGDRTTGVTCHRMIGQVDAGDVVDVVRVPVQEDATGFSLYYDLVDAAVGLFEQVVRRAEEGALPQRPQEGPSSYHARRVPYDGLIDLSWPRVRAERFIRAMYFPPYPPAIAIVDGTEHPVRTIGEFDKLIGPVPSSPVTRDARVPTPAANPVCAGHSGADAAGRRLPAGTGKT
jgi:methionyl-tRNA formyltransferase